MDINSCSFTHNRSLYSALVASSGVLRRRGHGASIDGHDRVFRINQAPTAGLSTSCLSHAPFGLPNHVTSERRHLFFSRFDLHRSIAHWKATRLMWAGRHGGFDC